MLLFGNIRQVKEMDPPRTDGNEKDTNRPESSNLSEAEKMERMYVAMAQFAEHESTFMQWQRTQMTSSSMGIQLLERFKKLFPVEFEGITNPEKAENWLNDVTRVLDAMQVVGEERVILATFTFTAAARTWWEAIKRQLMSPTTDVTPEEPTTISWEKFVEVFNDQYCPQSYRLAQETTFTHLVQGNLLVAQYEDKFASLSRYAPYAVDTDSKRC